MRIRFRITIPFVALFVVSYGVLAAVSIYLVSDATESQIADRLRDLSRLVVQWGGASPGTLKMFKEYQKVDMVMLVDGAPMATSLDAAELEAFKQAPINFEYGAYRYLQLGATEYFVVRTRVGEETLQGRKVIKEAYLMYPGATVELEKSRATGPLLLPAGIGIVCVVVIGFLIASSLARPIEEVSKKAREIGEGREREIGAKGGSKEIRELVSALDRMLAKLKESQQKLVEAEKAQVIRELAASVAHEIKNPLQAIKLLIEMEPNIAGGDRELLLNEIQRIELASLELISMAGPTRLVKEKVRLDLLADDTLKLLRRQLDHLKVRVEKRFAAAPELQLDADKIKRAVMNLILNGAQAMPQGGTIQVAVENGGGLARFSVTDQGPGVPEAVRPKIFEPFVTSKQDGVGLGLYVTKKIVEEHNGRVGFDSQPGRTTFWIELPNG